MGKVGGVSVPVGGATPLGAKLLAGFAELHGSLESLPQPLCMAEERTLAQGGGHWLPSQCCHPDPFCLPVVLLSEKNRVLIHIHTLLSYLLTV